MMKKIVFILCFLVMLGSTLEVVVVTQFTISKPENITMDEMYVGIGGQSDFTWGPYAVQLLDKDNNIIEEVNFSVEFVMYKDPGGTIDIDKTYRWLAVRFNENATKLRVVHGNNILFEESNLPLAVCNRNGTCDKYENIFSCPNDCSAKDEDNFCSALDDGICDPDCSYVGDKDCPYDGRGLDDIKDKPVPGSNNTKPPESGLQLKDAVKAGVVLFSVLFLLALIGIAVFLVFRAVKRKPRKGEEFD
ncbi:MAG: hypothetical protein ABIH99_01945 [Candidatus Micrarchaeota archaeon]